MENERETQHETTIFWWFGAFWQKRTAHVQKQKRIFLALSTAPPSPNPMNI